MSHAIYKIVKASKLGDPVLKSIVFCLAEMSDDEGVSWPAVETIAAITEVHPRTVQRKLDEAENRGIIRRLFRKNRSTKYIFDLRFIPADEERPQHPKQKKEDHDTAPPVTDLFGVALCQTTGGTVSMTGGALPPRIVIEPSLEPPSNNIGSHPFPKNSDMVDWVVTRWNEFAAANPAVSGVRVPINNERSDMIVRRATGNGKGQDKLQFWTEFFDHLGNSKFLRGLVPPSNNYPRPFSLRLTWALQAKNFADIMDGFYDKHSQGNTENRGSAMRAADRFASRVDASGLR